MIQVKVKSQYKGLVAIRDKYLLEAEASGQGLIIEHNDQQMVIPFNEIHTRVKGVSEKPVFNKFSRERHSLIYYLWQPGIKQPVLL
jgi:hypothetical protein